MTQEVPPPVPDIPNCSEANGQDQAPPEVPTYSALSQANERHQSPQCSPPPPLPFKREKRLSLKLLSVPNVEGVIKDMKQETKSLMQELSTAKTLPLEKVRTRQTTTEIAAQAYRAEKTLGALKEPGQGRERLRSVEVQADMSGTVARTLYAAEKTLAILTKDKIELKKVPAPVQDSTLQSSREAYLADQQNRSMGKDTSEAVFPVLPPLPLTPDSQATPSYSTQLETNNEYKRGESFKVSILCARSLAAATTFIQLDVVSDPQAKTSRIKGWRKGARTPMAGVEDSGPWCTDVVRGHDPSFGDKFALTRQHWPEHMQLKLTLWAVNRLVPPSLLGVCFLPRPTTDVFFRSCPLEKQHGEWGYAPCGGEIDAEIFDRGYERERDPAEISRMKKLKQKRRLSAEAAAKEAAQHEMEETRAYRRQT
eukprot:g9551.t1